MVLALLHLTRNQIQKIVVKDIISTERVRSQLRLLAILAVPVLGMVLLSPGSVRETFSLLLHPTKDLPPSEIFIDVTPKGVRIVRNGPVTIQASTSGAVPRSVELVFRSGGSEATVEKIPMSSLGEEKFAVTLPQMKENLHYRVATGPFASPWYLAEAVDLPRVANLQITLYPPDYSGLPAQTIQGGNVEGLRGSTIRLEAQTSKEIGQAKIVLDEGREIPLAVKGKSLEGSFVLFQPQKYRVLVEDFFGFTNSPIPYELRVLPDGFPIVELLRPVEDMEINGDETLTLEFTSRDDFGVQEVVLIAKVDGREERSSLHKGGNKKQLPRERYHWDVGKLRLREGSEVLYHLEVLDNDTISGPKVGSSLTLKLRLKNLKEEHRQVTELIRDLSNEMVDLLGDHLERDPAREPTLSQKMEQTIRRVEEILARTEEDRLTNFATWSDLQALKRNLEFTRNELLEQQAKAASPEDWNRLDDEISSELERMSLLAEDISKRLNAQEVANTAQDLVKSQERMLESLQQLKSGDKALDEVLKELSQLAQQLASLQQALSKMATQLPDEFVNSEAMRGLQFSDMFSTLNEIRQKMMEGDIQRALQMARELFNQMASLLASLRNSQQMAMSSGMGPMQAEMTRSTSRLQRIVQEQQEILVETEGVHKESQAKNEEMLSERVDDFQAAERQRLSHLEELFPDPESEEQEGVPFQEAEMILHQLAKKLRHQLQNGDIPGLVETTDAALKELGAMDQEGEHEGEPEALLNDLRQQLKTLLETPPPPLTGEQKEHLGDLAGRQRNLKEETRDLHERLTQLFQLFPSLDPKIVKSISEAADSMEKAQTRLGERDAEEAIPPEQEALAHLTSAQQQLQSSMSQMTRRERLGRIPLVYLFRSGRFIPPGRLRPIPGMPQFPEFDIEGGITGFDTEKFRAPRQGRLSGTA